MLQPALVIHEPLLHRGIPLISKPRTRCLHRRLPPLRIDAVLRVTKPVTLQLQPPFPPAIPGPGEETASIEFCDPLLPGITRLPSVRDGLEGMTPGLVGRADALPIGLCQAFRRFVGG